MDFPHYSGQNGGEQREVEVGRATLAVGRLISWTASLFSRIIKPAVGNE
jgi:hypothetical protein